MPKLKSALDMLLSKEAGRKALSQEGGPKNMNWPDGSLKTTAAILEHLDQGEMEKAKTLYESSRKRLPVWYHIAIKNKFQPNNDPDNTAHVDFVGEGKDTTPRPLLEQSQLVDFAHHHVEELIKDGKNVTKEDIIKHIMKLFKNSRPQIERLFQPKKKTCGAEAKSNKQENTNTAPHHPCFSSLGVQDDGRLQTISSRQGSILQQQPSANDSTLAMAGGLTEHQTAAFERLHQSKMQKDERESITAASQAREDKWSAIALAGKDDLLKKEQENSANLMRLLEEEKKKNSSNATILHGQKELEKKLDANRKELDGKLDANREKIEAKIDDNKIDTKVLAEEVVKTIKKPTPGSARFLRRSDSDKENTAVAPMKLFESPAVKSCHKSPLKIPPVNLLLSMYEERMAEFQMEFGSDFQRLETLNGELKLVRQEMETDAKRDKTLLATLNAKEQETLKAICAMPDYVRESYKDWKLAKSLAYDGIIERISEEDAPLEIIGCEGVKDRVATSLGLTGETSACLGHRVILRKDKCALLFEFNPLDASFDEDGLNEDLVSTYFLAVMGYITSFSISAHFEDEDVVLHVFSKEQVDASEIYSEALLGFKGAMDLPGVQSLTLESSEADGATPLPASNKSVCAFVDCPTENVFVTFQKTYIPQGMQVELARAKCPLKFEGCDFGMRSGKYPLLDGTNKNALRLVLKDKYFPFDQLEKAILGGRISSLGFIGLNDNAIKKHGGLHNLRSLFKAAQGRGFDIGLEACTYDMLGPGGLKVYLKGGESVSNVPPEPVSPPNPTGEEKSATEEWKKRMEAATSWEKWNKVVNDLLVRLSSLWV